MIPDGADQLFGRFGQERFLTGLKRSVIGLGQEGMKDEGLQSHETSCSPVAVPERHD